MKVFFTLNHRVSSLSNGRHVYCTHSVLQAYLFTCVPEKLMKND